MDHPPSTCSALSRTPSPSTSSPPELWIRTHTRTPSLSSTSSFSSYSDSLPGSPRTCSEGGTVPDQYDGHDSDGEEEMEWEDPPLTARPPFDRHLSLPTLLPDPHPHASTSPLPSFTSLNLNLNLPSILPPRSYPQEPQPHKRSASSTTLPELNLGASGGRGKDMRTYVFAGKRFVPLRMDLVRQDFGVRVKDEADDDEDEEEEGQVQTPTLSSHQRQYSCPESPCTPRANQTHLGKPFPLPRVDRGEEDRAGLKVFRFPTPSPNVVSNGTARDRDLKMGSRSVSPSSKARARTRGTGPYDPSRRTRRPGGMIFRRPHFRSISLHTQTHRALPPPFDSHSHDVEKDAADSGKEEERDPAHRRKLLLVGPAIAKHLQMGGGVRVKDFKGAVIGWMQ